MRKCPLSKNELQEKRAEALRTGLNRAARRKSRKVAVKPVVEAKKEESQKQA